MNKELALKIVSKNGMLLWQLPRTLIIDREVLLKSMSNMKIVGRRFYNFHNVKSNMKELEKAGIYIWTDREFILALVRSGISVIDKLIANKSPFLTDVDVIVGIIRNNDVNDITRLRKYVCLGDAVIVRGIKHSFKHLVEAHNNYNYVLQAVKYSGHYLDYANAKFSGDYQIVLGAVKGCGRALKFASQELRAEYLIVCVAVMDDGYALRHASDELRENYNLVLAAVRNNGNALQFASADLRRNYEIIISAIKNDGTVLEYVIFESEITVGRDIFLVAIKSHWRTGLIIDNWYDDREISIARVKSCGSLLIVLCDELAIDREIVMYALRESPQMLHCGCLKKLYYEFKYLFDNTNKKLQY